MVAVFVFILVAFGAGVVRHMLSQRAQTHRLEQLRSTECLAQALAVLALQKLAQEGTGSLRTALAAPPGRLADSPRSPIDLRDESGKLKFRPLVDALLAPQGEFSALAATCTWQVLARDFGAPPDATPLDRLYPAGKTGHLHLHVDLWYRRGTQADTTETFHFVVPCKVTPALLPVLSKFTLYVEKAAQPGQPFAWNRVKSDEGGRVAPDSPTPLVLFNGKDNLAACARLTSLEDLVKKPVGLVYLGGGPLTLFLAYGDCGTMNDPCNFGESMHFFQRARESAPRQWPFYQYRPAQPFSAEGAVGSVYHLAWDRGHCASEAYTDPGTRKWLANFAQHPHASWLGFNSLFRLLGPDSYTRFSPTLVLGEVSRGFQRGKCFKVVAGSVGDPFGFNPWLTSQEFTTRTLYYDRCPQVLQAMLNMLAPPPVSTSYEEYRDEFASTLVETEPYNHSLAFFASQYGSWAPRDPKAPNPVTTIVNGDPLDELVRPDRRPSAPFHQIPGRYAELAPGKDLTDLGALLDLACAREDRYAWVIDGIPEGSDWERELERRGLLTRTANGLDLNLNGWVLFRKLDRLVVKDSLRLLSDGGIVLDEGDIAISRPVQPTSGTILYLVARKGDIEVAGNGPTQVSLAARGTVTLNNHGHQREWGDRVLTVVGSVAAGRLPLDPAFKGAGISYLPELSAYPGAGEERVCVSLDPTPVLVGN
ncbi:MAG: hypothetical protein GX442_11255 [Candidatus Riflebacteria bacterium]|nr:hypothetical protein [Candidatus Riflebacteria bacterium]